MCITQCTLDRLSNCKDAFERVRTIAMRRRVHKLFMSSHTCLSGKKKSSDPKTHLKANFAQQFA
jgi:hypothetical protein